MRVTLGSLTLNFLRNLNADLERLLKLQEQLATGKRMHRPSDDPPNLPPVLSMRDALNAVQQYARNLQDTRTLLDAGQRSLQDAAQILHRLRELAVQGANGTLSTSDTQALAREVKELHDELVTLGNTQVAGKYIFGGTRSTTAPFTSDGTYLGNSNRVVREVDRGITLEATIPGDLPFSQALSAAQALQEALEAGDHDAVRATFPDLDAALDRLLAALAELGARANRVEVVQSRLGELEVGLRELVSVREDVDIAEVVVRLQAEENVYRAALAAGARLIQPSLVDFLR
ncbi:MAG: flagellar hook-associated protein FlgL [Armatimonadota bacterium]|nr:flagellar hook-associated protein FlgL [Armatimonadota bacterium]MDR7438852.1 flagellar hook-associated protein FlgL [Armatimonadota bacterium]MDR7562393.1 flagellar hook-associated protein FlgL [Armatimonadota bacterium]MDR7568933.1 flagellar hook-associated protein FlgL [Armatimonadota bacterium]MDR7601473.1 flagellar hook-associated protein FlgL [Armatimonadota bacterium]